LQYEVQSYFGIPENNKRFFDILIRNYPSGKKGDLEDIGILFREELVEGQIHFVANLQDRGELSTYFGHQTYDFNDQKDREYLKNSPLSSLLDF
jgi:hypothetical protein